MGKSKYPKLCSYKKRYRRKGINHYGNSAGKWRRFRAIFLAQNPLCETCSDFATEVDHRKRVLPDASNLLDASNCVALCKSCHSRKTFDCDGSFGRGKR